MLGSKKVLNFNDDFRTSFLEYERKGDPLYMFIYWRVRGLMPPYGTGSSMATILGIDVFGDNHDKKWFRPFKWWYNNVMRRIDRVYYDIYYRFFKKFYILKLNIPKTTWVDADERMFEACFKILELFVEGELRKVPENKADQDTSYRGYRLHSHGDEAAIDLYLWYKIELPALEKDFNEDMNRWASTHTWIFKPADDGRGHLLNIDEIEEYERKYDSHYIEDIKEKKLRELIDMRRKLWT